MFRLAPGASFGDPFVILLTLLAVLVVGVATGHAQTPAPPPTVEVGLGRGLTVRSADDQYSLTIRARIQERGTFIGFVGDERADESEVTIRRMRLVFQGNTLGPALTYYIQVGMSNQDMESDLRVPLRDAYLTWTPVKATSVRFGQMKVPFGRQRVTSSSALQMADRSIVVGELNLDRDVGVQVFSKDLFGSDGKLGYAVGLFSGEGRNRLGREGGLLYSARLEAWPLGPFDDYVEADIRRDPRLRLAFGGGVAYNQDSNRPRSTTGTPFPEGDFDYTHAGADFALKRSGLSITGEVLYRKANADAEDVIVGGAPAGIVSRSGWGAYVQGGQMVTDRAEVTARYGRLLPRDGTDPLLVTATEAGAGFSYYFREHNLKLQTDYFYLTSEGAPGAHQVRSQFQLFF